ncbi:MAG: hypothetical protein Q9184_002376 [Pyrenodesmia sp. 2 TL-2023]
MGLGILPCFGSVNPLVEMYAKGFRSSDGFIIFVVGAAVFTDMLLYGLIVPILPYTLTDRIGLPQKEVQKWNSILLGSFGAALTVGSRDRVPSRQTPFLFGLIALGLSTLAISLTYSIVVLLIARILQGLSGAVVYTVGYAILFDVVGSERIGQAMGFVSMSQSFGLLVGPAIGGPLYEWGGYLKTFIPAFVLIAIEIALRGLVIVRKERGGRNIHHSPDDIERDASKAPLLADSGTVHFHQPSYGTKDNIVPSVLERNPTPTASASASPPPSPSTNPSHAPLLPTFHLLLSHPRIPLALLALFLLNTLLTSYDAIIPIHIATTFAYPPSYSSLLFLTMVSPFLLSPLTGYIIDHPRYGGTKYPALLGWCVLTPPVFLLRNISTATAHPLLCMALCLFAIGLGTAMTFPALMAEVSLVVESIERDRPGVFGDRGVMSLSFGVMNTAFAGGFLAGPLLAGWLIGCVGWEGLGMVLGCGGVVCAVGVGVGTGGWVWRR